MESLEDEKEINNLVNSPLKLQKKYQNLNPLVEAWTPILAGHKVLHGLTSYIFVELPVFEKQGNTS